MFWFVLLKSFPLHTSRKGATLLYMNHELAPLLDALAIWCEKTTCISEDRVGTCSHACCTAMQTSHSAPAVADTNSASALFPQNGHPTVLHDRHGANLAACARHQHSRATRLRIFNRWKVACIQAGRQHTVRFQALVPLNMDLACVSGACIACICLMPCDTGLEICMLRPLHEFLHDMQCADQATNSSHPTGSKAFGLGNAHIEAHGTTTLNQYK